MMQSSCWKTSPATWKRHAAPAGRVLGAREVGFTVLSISMSLIAVFIPILLMGGIVGRLFREFAVTLSVAIVVSLVISLTTTPMMCALFLQRRRRAGRPAVGAFCERALRGYRRTLTWALRHRRLVLLIFVGTIGLNVALYIVVPKGFFPAAGYRTFGRIAGGGPERFVPVDEPKAAPDDGHRAGRSRGGACRGLYRRWQRRRLFADQ